MRPVCVIDAVGLTPRHLGPDTPVLQGLASRGFAAPLEGVLPAVTCTAQATILTGRPPAEHGIVGNGWFDRELGEVLFWRQSNALVRGEKIYEAARRPGFTCAKLFWWFNQGAAVDWSVTPKPHYGCDGDKIFGIHGSPPDLPASLEKKLGPFPFPAFWGPSAGLPSTRWIARAAAEVIRRHAPTLTLVYLPHLDYDLQRFGPEAAPPRLRELDECAGWVADAAHEKGATVVVLSEYGIVRVRQPVLINRALREAGWLTVRDGPFGEMLDPFASRAFAVADHQVAHVYVRDPALRPAVRERLATLPGVAEVLGEEGKQSRGLGHSRSGDLVALAHPEAWFAYPYWRDDARAPDFARTVDIFRKPGYDPCELFFDPRLWFPRGRAAFRLLQKKIGFRARFDVVPLDPTLVQGSHGVPPADPLDGPVFLCEDRSVARERIRMTDVKSLLLELLR